MASCRGPHLHICVQWVDGMPQFVFCNGYVITEIVAVSTSIGNLEYSFGDVSLIKSLQCIQFLFKVLQKVVFRIFAV